MIIINSEEHVVKSIVLSALLQGKSIRVIRKLIKTSFHSHSLVSIYIIKYNTLSNSMYMGLMTKPNLNLNPVANLMPLLCYLI